MVVEVELLRVLRCWVWKENESEKSVAEKKHGVPLVFHSFTLSLFHSFTLSLFHSFTLSLFHSFTLSLFHYSLLSMRDECVARWDSIYLVNYNVAVMCVIL
jgi:hypothetical protein